MALFNIAEKILGELESLALQEIGLVLGVKAELGKLKDILSTIQAVIHDAEKKESESNAVKDWLEKLKDAVYDADDVLDNFSTEALRRKVMPTNKMAQEVRTFFSNSNQFVFGLKMGHKIKAIRERLDEISKNRMQFHFDEKPVEKRVQIASRSHSFVRKEKIIGRDADKEKIVKLLLDSDVKENVSIIPIVGLGGLGKTTLAQLVYNDEIVKENFHLKMWVRVTQDFDVQSIAEKIIVSATNEESRYPDMDQVQKVLRKHIDGKKYLLVLDDVWIEDRDQWLELNQLLMGGAVGSKILVTSRSETVAKITSASVSPYILRALSKDDSWLLFEQMAPQQCQELEPSTLIEIRKHIVEKCVGAPLAIRTLGSLLYSKDPQEWLNFVNNELSKIPQNENDILPILKISYDCLPSFSKHCFAYCSLFPKGHRIRKQTLIKLWVAQGFVRSDGNQHPEDVGDEFFMRLLAQSFFEDTVKDELGNVVSCKINNLMHDLAQRVAGIECSKADLDAGNISEKIRHVSLNSNKDSRMEVLKNWLRVKKLRTFLLAVPALIEWAHGRPSKSPCETLMASLKSLRVLDLHEASIETLPNSIGKLKHLRYLDLSRNYLIKTLPSSISSLQNLQTLKLSGCGWLEELPRDIRKLISLRHLEIDECYKLTHMPRRLGQLTSLQTLTRFVVGEDRIVSMHSGGLAELNALINLKGELAIVNLGHVNSPMSESKAANLKEKQHLQCLTLEWEPEASDAKVESNDEVLLEGLQPHPNLKALGIIGYGGARFPTWMADSLVSCLPNLVRLTLRSCERCRCLPPLGQLPSLKFLYLHEMTAVEYLDNGSYEPPRNNSDSGIAGGGRSTAFFPSLEKLWLMGLPKLKGWWKKQEVNDDNDGGTTTSMVEHQHQPQQHLSMPSFPRLSELRIWKCPNLTYMPLLPCLEDLALCDLSVKIFQLSTAMTATSDSSITAAAATSSSSMSSPLSVLKSIWIGAATSSSSVSSPLSKLKSLLIGGIEDLEYLPKECLRDLTSVKHLKFNSCHSLRSLPEEGLIGLTSLRSLWIFNCEGLTSLSCGIQHLSALKELHIRCCKELDMSDANDEGKQWQGFRNLSLLDLYKIPKMVSLPEWLQQVTSLQNLFIESCDGLMALPEWIGNLTSLRRLEIIDCPRLTSLPKGFSSLDALQQLKIEKCPTLLERCQKEKGEDWLKISRIPKLNLVPPQKG